MTEYKPGLPQPVLDLLLGAIATSRDTKPSADQAQAALEQLAKAAAAICRAVKHGSRERFEMIFAVEMERRFSANDPEGGDDGDI